MTIGRCSLRAALLLTLSATAGVFVAGQLQVIADARAQPPPSEEDKKKKEREKRQPPPPAKAVPQPPPKPQALPPKAPPPAPPPKASAPPIPPKASTPPPAAPPPRAGPPPVEKRLPPSFEKKGSPPQMQGQPDRQGPPPQMQGKPSLEKKGPPPQMQAQPPIDKKTAPTTKQGGPQFDPGAPRAPTREQALPPTQIQPAPQQGVAPQRAPQQGIAPQPAPQQAVTPQPAPPQQGVAPPATGPGGPLPPARSRETPFAVPALGPSPKRFDDVRKERREHVEDGGRRKVIQEFDNRIIVKQDNRVIIRHNEAERFMRRPGARSERRSDGMTETFYDRPDGIRIVTVVDTNGRLIRRYRRHRDGRERDIIDNRRFYRNVGIGVGVGIVGGIIALNLPPPRITIPRDRYIVDYDRASDDDLYEALDAPPIETLDRGYSLEEIRDNYGLRARVRRIDLDTINFEFGSWEVGPDQYHKLERIARAILRLLDRNPEAVVMVEGHTDAVGSEEDNVSLSDRRASAVAEILTDQFGVPAENLVTQGYGEEHLKVDTQEAERLNRRVTILNISGLMAER